MSLVRLLARLIRRVRKKHGGYGVTVSTGVCGAPSEGSIPSSRPRKRLLVREVFFVWKKITPFGSVMPWGVVGACPSVEVLTPEGQKE